MWRTCHAAHARRSSRGVSPPHPRQMGQIVGLLDDRAIEQRCGVRARVCRGLVDAGAPGLPREVRRRFRDLGPGARIVHLLHIAAGHAVPVPGGQSGLHGHHCGGQGLGVGAEPLRQPRQIEHPCHVGRVGLADLRASLLAVVRLVGQAEPGLPHPGRVMVWVVQVDLDIDGDRAREAGGDPRSQDAGQGVLVVCIQNRSELGLQRGRSQLLDALLVEEGGVQGGDLGRWRGRFPPGRSERRSAPPARRVRRGCPCRRPPRFRAEPGRFRFPGGRPGSAPS